MAKTRKKTTDQRQKLMMAGVLILVAGALAGGIVIGVRQTWRRMANRPEFRVRPLDMEIENEWINVEAFKKQLVELDTDRVLDTSVSLFTPQLADRVARALARSPWVREVKSVTREFPDTLNAEIVFREPYALINWKNGPRCVDRDGIALNQDYYDLAGRLEMLGPVVTVPSTVSAPRKGMLWEDVEVREGLAMVRLCREQFAKSVAINQIEISDALASDGKKAAMATLILAGGTRVQWGRTPDSPPSPAEVRTPQKAETLLALTRQEGESLQRFRSIDIRWPEPPLCE